MVYLSESSVHGFGVFADKNYNIGDTLELCYYLVTDDSDMTNTCILHDYVFGTPNEEEEYLVPLGNAMMYNHSSDPNAEWEIHDDNNFVRFKALKLYQKAKRYFTTTVKNIGRVEMAKAKSTVNKAGNYTKPGMRKRMFSAIKAGSKGGAGQWSARKAQLLAQRYKKGGGGYK